MSAVPVSAVRVDQARPYVLAVVGDHVEQRKVTLGQRGELPVDGSVEDGRSSLDESMVTGESMPVTRAVGEAVIGGAINKTGSFVMRADKVGADTLLSQIVQMVAQAQRSRAPIQRLADRVSGWFVPTVIGVAVLAALIRRQRDGVGCDIDISMVESMSRFMSPRLMPYLGSGELSRRTGGRDSVIAIYQVFETADEPMTLGLGNDAIWKRFWEAVDQPEMASRVEYSSNAKRRASRDEIVVIISEILKSRPRAEWLEILGNARVPAGPIHRLDQLADDQALKDSGFLYQSNGVDGPIPQVGLGIRFDGRSEGTSIPPPKLGEHTDEVLREWLAIDSKTVEQLRVNRVI